MEEGSMGYERGCGGGGGGLPPAIDSSARAAAAAEDDIVVSLLPPASLAAPPRRSKPDRLLLPPPRPPDRLSDRLSLLAEPRVSGSAILKPRPKGCSRAERRANEGEPACSLGCRWLGSAGGGAFGGEDGVGGGEPPSAPAMT